MKLSEILQDLDGVRFHADASMEITGLENDSRAVEPGFAFVAVRGFETDGHKYIPQAVERGAVRVCPRLCSRVYPSDTPPSLLPAQPPQATITSSAATVSSPTVMEKPPFRRFTAVTGVPAIRRTFSRSNANRSTSNTEFAESDKG